MNQDTAAAPGLRVAPPLDQGEPRGTDVILQSILVQLHAVETRLSKEIQAVETRLSKEIQAVDTRLSKQIQELGERMEAVEIQLSKTSAGSSEPRRPPDGIAKERATSKVCTARSIVSECSISDSCRIQWAFRAEFAKSFLLAFGIFASFCSPLPNWIKDSNTVPVIIGLVCDLFPGLVKNVRARVFTKAHVLYQLLLAAVASLFFILVKSDWIAVGLFCVVVVVPLLFKVIHDVSICFELVVQ
jgi:hypothetical protein